MVTLGIDFGLKHVGLAVSDVNETIASPLKTITHRNLRTTTEKVLALCQEQGVQQIVLGHPHNGSSIATLVEGLAKRLGQHYPVHLIDESATTYQAETMIQLPRSSHARAAALILERHIHAKK